MLDFLFEPFEANYKRCGCYIRSEELAKQFP